MKNVILVILILLLLCSAAGCAAIGKSVSDAYNGGRQSIENTNVNNHVCDSDWRNTPLAICPEKTAPPLVNITPTQLG